MEGTKATSLSEHVFFHVKMGVLCIVRYCENVYLIDKHVSFHELPSDLKLRSEWLEILQKNNCLRDSFKITTKTRICGDHFLAADYKLITSSKKVLHIGACPRVKFVNVSTTAEILLKKKKD